MNLLCWFQVGITRWLIFMYRSRSCKSWYRSRGAIFGSRYTLIKLSDEFALIEALAADRTRALCRLTTCSTPALATKKAWCTSARPVASPPGYRCPERDDAEGQWLSSGPQILVVRTEMRRPGPNRIVQHRGRIPQGLATANRSNVERTEQHHRPVKCEWRAELGKNRW